MIPPTYPARSVAVGLVAIAVAMTIAIGLGVCLARLANWLVVAL